MDMFKYVSNIDPTSLVGDSSKLVSEFDKAEKLRSKSDFDVNDRMVKYIPMLRDIVFTSPGLFKADMEAYASLISFGHPIVENILFFTWDNHSRLLTLDEKRDPEKISSFAIKLLDMKYDYEYTFYSALPFSFCQCTGFRNNIITYYSKVLKKLYPKPKGEIFNIPGGLILHHLGGIFESMIGLIPLLERDMVKIGLHDDNQPVFELNMNNNLTKEMWESLEPYATGSRLLGRMVTRGLFWDNRDPEGIFTLYPFPRGTGPFEDLAEEKRLMVLGVPYSDPLYYTPRVACLIKDPRRWGMDAYLGSAKMEWDDVELGYKIVDAIMREVDKGFADSLHLLVLRELGRYVRDNYDKEFIDRIIRGEVFLDIFSLIREIEDRVKDRIKRTEFDGTLYRIIHRDELDRETLDPDLNEEFKMVVEKYLSKEEKDYLFNAKYDLKDALRSVIEGIGQKKLSDEKFEEIWSDEISDFKRWRKKMVKRVPELRDRIEKISFEEYADSIDPIFYPVARRKHFFIQKAILKYAEELYRGYWDKVREVKDLIEDKTPKRKPSGGDKRFILSSIGSSYLRLMKTYYPCSGSPLLIAEAGYLFKYLTFNGFRGYRWRDVVKLGLAILPREVAKGYKKPRFSFSIFRRKKDEDEKYSFDWLRYERQIDEAKKNLDAFDKFKQLYYLEKALRSYEDARRVLLDMMNRYRDKDKQSEITQKLILLNSQIEDIEKMIKELKKGKL